MHIQEDKLIKQLTGSGRKGIDQRIVDVMLTIPRHWFIPAEYRHRAYEDCALPIGYEQTISQPYMVALMTEMVTPQPHHKVLEIGSGSGYQTAILSKLVSQVYSIEYIEPLMIHAKEALERLNCQNVELKQGNGHLGWPDEAPFDSILIACAPEFTPWHLTDQLKPEGQLIVPVGEKNNQKLVRIFRRDNQWVEEVTMNVRFVPMVGDLASN